MKIDPNNPNNATCGVKPSFTPRLVRQISVFCVLSAFGSLGLGSVQNVAAQFQSEAPPNALSAASPNTGSAENSIELPKNARDLGTASSESQAQSLMEQVLMRLSHGAAFDCEVRQRVRVADREALGVGSYLQVGGGTGQFSLQVSMHDGDGKHTLKQISDGRLAYTRTEIGEIVSLIRVDVGSLDEGARVLGRKDPIKPSMLVGGPCEMLDTIRRDYDLRLGTSELNGQPLLVIIGTLKSHKRQEMANYGGKMDFFPTQVNVMIAAENSTETGFGQGLPVRIEHRATPTDSEQSNQTAEPRLNTPNEVKTVRQGKLISLLELYSFRQITPPPIQRFRFENQDASVTFVNETRRYEDRFNIRVSAKERARYR